MSLSNRRSIVIALALSMFLAAMEMTAVSTAMPTVIGDLGDIHFYSWVFTSYMLTSTVTVPIFGKLSDIYGRKPIVLIGIFVFLAGSTLCGLSTSIFQLIVFRAIQGLGAGALMPIALTIVGDIYPLEQRGKIQAVFSSVWGVAGIVGPLLGAMIVKYLNWRWVFYINLPFGIAAMTMLYFSFHEQIEKSQKKLDTIGGLLLTVAVVCLLLAGSGSHWVEYSIVGLFLLGFFVGVELKAADPILPMHLFKKKLILVASISSAMLGTIMFASLTYLPLFIQGAMNGTPTDAGTVLTPMIVGWPIAGAIAGRLIVRYSFRPFILAGAACNFVGAIALAAALQMRLGYPAIYFASCLLALDSPY